jgi:hypothetical protein
MEMARRAACPLFNRKDEIYKFLGGIFLEGSFEFGDVSADTFTLTGIMTVAAGQKIQFRDTGIYLTSGADGKLTLSADGTGADDITLNGTVSFADNATMGSGKAFYGTILAAAASGNANLALDGAGTGTVTINGTATGDINLGANTVLAADKTLVLSGTGSASAPTVYSPAIASASAGNVSGTIDAAGSGTLTIQGTATGDVNIGADVVFSANKTLELSGTGTISAPTVYAPAIASASSGNVAGTVDAAGTGTLTLQGTATGNLLVGANTVFSADKTIALSGTGNIAITGTLASHAYDFQGTVGTSTDGTVIRVGTSSAWIDHATAGQCAVKMLASNSATTGDFATMRLRARSDASGITVCTNSAASAGVDAYGNLFGVQGLAQPNAYNQTDAANIVSGLYSCIDASGTSTGRRWSLWVDDHSTSKASGGHYLARLSLNPLGAGVAIDGCFTVYSGGLLPVWFNFEDAIAGGFLDDASASHTTPSGELAVRTPAGTKYITLNS